ncbi:DUF559 domain-containing protein [Microbacterium sp. DT81.1]|uniref:DUF559 domain-containing protein n=1 Tax=Microbacterium sp. DT81.1 TaxID=3393413 RepID=UPI003CF3D790
MTPPATQPVTPTWTVGWSYAELRAEGLSRRSIDRALRSGSLLRARRDRYLHGDAPAHVAAAVACGGRLDCLSLLGELGVFVQEKPMLHVQLTPGTGHGPGVRHGIVRHWRHTAADARSTTTDIIEALAQACRCQNPRSAIATLDSAWHAGWVDEEGIAAVFRLLPRRFRVLRSNLERRSESGPETLVRLMARALGCDVEAQVSMPGVGRVDLVLDGLLVIECDSQEFHQGWTSQQRDRSRDLALAAMGYVTLRPWASAIMWQPETVVDAIRGLHGTRA